MLLTSTIKQNISCDVEWILEDKLLYELFGIICKYKDIGVFASTKHLKKSLYVFIKLSYNKCFILFQIYQNLLQ